MIIAICAVLVAGSAVPIVRAAARSGSGLARRREVIGRAAVRISRDAADARDRMARTTTTVERMRVDGMSWDQDMDRLTNSLRAQRQSIERMTQGRLAKVIRLAGVVSKAARVAFLWR